MSPIDRAKISKLIAMLCSNYEGERFNALRALDRIMAEHGLTWTDIAQAFEGISSARREPPRSNWRRNMAIAFGCAPILVASVVWFKTHIPDPPKPQTPLQQTTTAMAQPVQKSGIEDLTSPTAQPVRRFSDADLARMPYYKDKKFSKLMEILCPKACSDEEIEEALAISKFPDKFLSSDGICPPGYKTTPTDLAHCLWNP
jgi:hypothetical protein